MAPAKLVLKNSLTEETHSSVLMLDDSIYHTATERVTGVLSVLATAAKAIDAKAAALGSAVGTPLGGVTWGSANGIFTKDAGYKRQYTNGIIYFLPPAGPCFLHGAILQEYLSLGGEGSFLGYPTTDERSTANGTGRYVHFEIASIYWSYATGAHEIHGSIRDRWAALGWEQSWLGFPIRDEVAFTDGGRISQFEHGAIYWWPDTGAIEMGDITLRYKGLYCFGETDEASESDEPYVVFGILNPPPAPQAAPTNTLRTQIYGDVDAGDERPDDLELYRGGANGLLITLSLFENDQGNPDAYLGEIKSAVDLAGKGVSAGCGALFGAEAAPTCQSIWGAVAPKLVDALNTLWVAETI
jgi:hypothetical protein